LWDEFAGEYDAIRLQERYTSETFFYLFCKYAWAVPSTYGEPGFAV
jgi:hypothetical protein